MFYDIPEGPQIYYEIVGKGDPLLLIAGTGCDHLWWAPQIEYFSRFFTVIACDNRGAGRSSIIENPSSYSSAVMADDLAALLEHLQLGPAHIIGHSLGSCIAQQLLIRHPQLIRSGQLHATWVRADEWLKRAFIGTSRYFTERKDPHFNWKTIGMWVFSPIYLEERGPKNVAEIISNEFIRNPYLNAYEGLLGHLYADEHHDSRELLKDVEVPTLVTAGELDVSIPPRYGWEAYTRLPSARWHLFTGPRSAHAYTIEMAEEFNHICLDFMKEH